MRIAYLTPIYPMPSQTFIRREIAALEALGFTIDRFTLRRYSGELADAADDAERQRTCAILEAGAFGLAKVMVLEALGRPLRFSAAMAAAVRLGQRSERGLIRHFIYLAEACWLRRRVAQCGSQHVHAHFGSNSADIALLSHLLGGPAYSITIHGPEDFDAPRSLSLHEKVHRAAFVAAVSEFTRSQLYRWCGTEDWRKIHVIRCGLDALFLKAATVSLPEQPRLVNVGRLCEQKGQLLLVQAAAQLRDRGLPFELVVVGEGPLRKEIEQLVDHLDLRDHVRFTGVLSNQGVRRELEAARTLVLPSFAEGLPVVIMEALALGRPVISTYIAGIPELVTSRTCGWLVPAGAIDALTAAMAEALTADPAELEEMGRAGRALVAREHDAHAEAKKLAALFSTRRRPQHDAPTSQSSPRAGVVAVG